MPVIQGNANANNPSGGVLDFTLEGLGGNETLQGNDSLGAERATIR